jgi:uncharacterized protein
VKGFWSRRQFLRTASAAPAALASLPALVDRKPPSPRVPAVRISTTPYTPSDYPIRGAPWSEVSLRDDFWRPKVARNAEVTIPFEVRKVASGRALDGNVLEAAMLSLKTHPDESLRATVEAAVRTIASQPAKGNSGFEVAAAWFTTTGSKELVERARHAADALYDDFQVNNPPFSGGERDAINCIQLYRVTRDRKHLDLAKHYLDIRGLENSVNRSRHNQSYMPVLEQSEAVGHAVNSASLMVSLADVGVLTGLSEYLETARRMWSDAVTRKMYITGGIGSTGNEGFGEAYSLPNISAYAETCAVLMFITLNHRLFLATGDSRYIDAMERGMYNNAIDGVAASGDRFFYVNRLASAGDGRDLRWQHASLECCPPNLVRFLASMPGLIYAQDLKDTIYVNLYVTSDVSFRVGGASLAISVDSGMPWDGKSSVAVSTRQPVDGTIKLRIPGWARNQPAPGELYSYTRPASVDPVISVNGVSVSSTPDASGYVSIAREWHTGDRIAIELPMAVRTVKADARVRDNRGRVAIERGPVVYCAEWPEAKEGRVLELLLDSTREMTTSWDRSLFGGATVVHAHTRRITDPDSAAAPLTLIPYHLWANRGRGEMAVWLSSREYAPGDVGPAGGLIFYVNPNYRADGWRYLEAAPVDQSAGARWGCFRNQIAGARGTAVGTGRQNTGDILKACSDAGTAARLCTDYRLNGIDGWFLPSLDELALMYRNLKDADAASSFVAPAADNFSYWTSSQQTADMASHIDFADHGRQHYDDKDFPRRVRAIRSF